MTNLAYKSITDALPENLHEKLAELKVELNQRVVGQAHNVDLCIAAFLAGGHVLLEGAPGVGKTSLASSLAYSFGGIFHRVQMTSDMLPSDILGVIRLVPGGTEFEFRRGPIFANVLLVDELNRTGPKTQTALLEAMAEQTVSMDGISAKLPDPFFVIATQNPLESVGVYPLAESQLDRFMMKLELSIPSQEEEKKFYRNFLEGSYFTSQLQKVSLCPEDIRLMRNSVKEVFVEDSILNYCQELLRLTRSHGGIIHGASVRAGVQFLTAARAMAYSKGRNYVLPDDVKAVAIPVLAHRIVLLDESHNNTKDRCNLLEEILEACKAPR